MSSFYPNAKILDILEIGDEYLHLSCWANWLIQIASWSKNWSKLTLAKWNHAVLNLYENSSLVKIITWVPFIQMPISWTFWKEGNMIFDFDVDHVWKIRLDLDQIFEWSYEIIHDFLKNLRKFLSLFSSSKFGILILMAQNKKVMTFLTSLNYFE